MIFTLILAAGESKRMGQPKMLMAWGRSTVLQTVIATYQAAKMDDILVITGGAREQVESLAGDHVKKVYNENYALGGMLSSVQTGLTALPDDTRAVLIALGDQPQVALRTVEGILGEFRETGAPLIVPSFQMHRGHPWLVGSEYWKEILAMRSPGTLRDFLDRHGNAIHYLEMDSAAILQDLDTPDDYLRSGPSIAIID